MSIEIGNRVRQIRANTGLNQREFASRLGISSGGISQIESGKAMPGGDFLLRIHQEFSVDITWLLTGMSVNEQKVNPTELPKEKQALLDAYDGMSADDRKTLLRVGESLSQPKPNKFAS
ncbi:helix-turn-helix transcriptional regulator [Salmonella enterica]|nr:helix-turn-helix transcriptional regulator [Salmonella enterica]EJU2993586.1 helix-turn-helix transcriptional regulator [Salmonella enterica]